jgi:hypothetical protein
MHLVDRVFRRLSLRDLFQASGWVNFSNRERAAGKLAWGGLTCECSLNATRWQHNTRERRVVSKTNKQINHLVDALRATVIIG